MLELLIVSEVCGKEKPISLEGELVVGNLKIPQ